MFGVIYKGMISYVYFSLNIWDKSMHSMYIYLLFGDIKLMIISKGVEYTWH